MTKKTKITLGVVALIAVVTVAVVASSPTMLQGKLMGNLNPIVIIGSDSITRCDLVKEVVLAKKIAIGIQNTNTSSACSPYLEAAVKAGLIDPAITFKPNASVTRAEAVKIVVMAWEWELINPAKPTFSDVPTNAWYYSPIETAHKVGVDLCNGENQCLNGKFSPSVNASKVWTKAMVKSAASI